MQLANRRLWVRVIVSTFIGMAVVLVVAFSVWFGKEREIFVIQPSVYLDEKEGFVPVSRLVGDKEEKMASLRSTVTKQFGRYYWTHGGVRRPVRKIARVVTTASGTDATYSMFLNPNGYGQILVQHMSLPEDFTMRFCGPRLGLNASKYILSDGPSLSGLLVDVYRGSTTPSPYPDAVRCINQWTGEVVYW